MKNQIHNKNNTTPVAFVDIDETICFYENERIYEQATPSPGNIEKINKLYQSGWKIVYWTARGSAYPENKERLEYYRNLTLTQLVEWNASFHELQIGDSKPLYDMIVDDKAVRIEEL